METDAIKLFISYRRTDSPGHAGRLSDAVRSKYGKDNVFQDVSSIRGGVHFPSVIEKAIVNSSVLIVVVGENWAARRFLRTARIFDKADWIRKEIETAIQENKHILPVLVNGGLMPFKSHLPESIQFFADLNSVTLNDAEWGKDIQTLFDEIESLVQSPPLPIPIKESKPDKQENKYLTFLTLFLGIIVVVGGIYQFSKYVTDTGSAFVIKKNYIRDQGISDNWRDKIVRLTAVDSSNSSAFFINSDGYLLTLTGRMSKDSVFEFTTNDQKKHIAHVVSKVSSNETNILLLKTSLENTSFLKLRPVLPTKDLSIEILGVEGMSSNWKRYTARVMAGSASEVTYLRPEDGWIGMMGAPVVDVSDDVTFAIHMGSSKQQMQTIDRKVAQGVCLTKGKLDSLFQGTNIKY